MFIERLERINWLKLNFNRELRRLSKDIIKIAVQDSLIDPDCSYQLLQYQVSGNELIVALQASDGHQIQVALPLDRFREAQNENLLCEATTG